MNDTVTIAQLHNPAIPSRPLLVRALCISSVTVGDPTPVFYVRGVSLLDTHQ
jgi:hypothetical protein